jgi:hypothetical protein
VRASDCLGRAVLDLDSLMTANVDRVRWFKISKKKYRIRQEWNSARSGLEELISPPHADKRRHFKLKSLSRGQAQRQAHASAAEDSEGTRE